MASILLLQQFQFHNIVMAYWIGWLESSLAVQKYLNHNKKISSLKRTNAMKLFRCFSHNLLLCSILTWKELYMIPVASPIYKNRSLGSLELLNPFWDVQQLLTYRWFRPPYHVHLRCFNYALNINPGMIMFDHTLFTEPRVHIGTQTSLVSVIFYLMLKQRCAHYWIAKGSHSFC
mgnify:FL=1